MILIILTAFFVSALISFASTPWVLKFAKRYKLVDNPKTRPHPAHIHKTPVPKGGGLAIFLAIFLIFLQVYQKTYNEQKIQRK